MQLSSFVGGEKALAIKIPLNPISRTPQNASSTRTRRPLSQLHGEGDMVQFTGLSLNLGCQSRVYAILSSSAIASSLSGEDEKGLPSTWDPDDLVGNSCSVTISETNMDEESLIIGRRPSFASNLVSEIGGARRSFEYYGLEEVDPKIRNIIRKEKCSQFRSLELSASKIFTSQTAMAICVHETSHSMSVLKVSDVVKSRESLADLKIFFQVRSKRSRTKFTGVVNALLLGLVASHCGVSELVGEVEATICLVMLTRGVDNSSSYF